MWRERERKSSWERIWSNFCNNCRVPDWVSCARHLPRDFGKNCRVPDWVSCARHLPRDFGNNCRVSDWVSCARHLPRDFGKNCRELWQTSGTWLFYGVWWTDGHVIAQCTRELYTLTRELYAFSPTYFQRMFITGQLFFWLNLHNFDRWILQK